MLRKKTFTIITIIIVLLLTTTSAYAHRMLIRPVEPGLIQVVFDDDTVAQTADVILYDEDRQVLGQGNVNAEGYFEYDTSLPVTRIEANDGVGHSASWLYGAELNEPEPMLPRVLLAVSAFIFIAAFFHYRSSQKGKKQA
ncbi:hypothetical protein [Dethiobacter alkaliphilus]|uniref:hypothetical protein n=1 Tax=Dethiobacter alkaliphilus TaxID=427926 RepID=UPI0022262168|nr:hypothetical protein [Dethiobacter alkaliphilus]MCW3489422.1 hypothetical protein [Dethiobacter alkaliphilus]